MRNRHMSRLCRSCQAAMARQEDACWQCGSQWASEEGPRTTLRVINGEASAHVASAPRARTAIAVADGEGAATQTRADRDRWMNEGGSFDSAAAAAVRATTGR